MTTERPAYNRAAHPEMSDKQYSLYHRKEYQAWYRKNHNKKPNAAPVQQNGSSEVVPAALTQCCVCGARFYVAKGASRE